MSYLEWIISRKDNGVIDHRHKKVNVKLTVEVLPINCNVNYRLTQKIAFIFYYLKRIWLWLYNAINLQVWLKENVVLNGMEKCITFELGKGLVFIDSMEFVNYKLESLIYKLTNY